MSYLFFLIVGIAGLYFGSGYVVDSAKVLAEKLNISQTLIGLTVISIGTSIPEIMTNLFSGLKVKAGANAAGIAIGTNLGSDITQITFILGFTALFGTMYATKKLLRRDGLMVLLSIILVFIVGFTGSNVSYSEGVLLLIIYFVYLYYVSKDEKFISKVMGQINNKDEKQDKYYFDDIILMILGIAILIFASHLVVDSALKLSELWGVAQSFIGVMIIGVGTALPELSTAIRAIFKKAGNISIGTLIGSNITDPMLSLPIGAIAAGSIGLNFDKNLLFFDIPFWFIVSMIALLLFRKDMKIGKEKKIEGLLLIGLYILFVFIKFRFFLH
jgi:cation:H+ antiporter